MNIQPQSTQPISDDQELAKVLAGLNNDGDNAAPAEEIVTTPAPALPPAPDPSAADPAAAPVDTPAPDEASALPPVAEPTPAAPVSVPVSS